MSKYAELYVNVCSFMDHFLSEILPEIEPTDSIKKATKDLLSALLKYTRIIDYDVSHIINEKESSGEPFSLRREKLSGPLNVLPAALSLHMHGFSEFNITTDNNPPLTHKNENNNLDLKLRTEPPSPKNTLTDDNISSMANCQNNNANDTHSTIENNASVNAMPNILDEHSTSETLMKIEVKNEQKQDNCSDPPEDAKRKCEPSTSEGAKRKRYSTEDSESSTPNDTRRNSEDSIISLENTFLKDFFLTDSDSSSKLEAPSTNKKPNTEKIQSKTDLEAEPIPLAFIELNKCLATKLIASAHYCWSCGFAVNDLSTLKNHLKSHQEHVVDSEVSFTLIDICEKCSFSAVAPIPVINKLCECHNASHITPSPLHDDQLDTKPLIHEKNKENEIHYSFIKKHLSNKYKNRTGLSSFLGICLPCLTHFDTPLEWNCHIYEFQHFETSRETIIKCNPCCLVILGLDEDFKAINYLSIEEHVNFCLA